MTAHQPPTSQVEEASQWATTLTENWTAKGIFRGGVFANNANAFLNLLLALIEGNAEKVFAHLAQFSALPQEAVPVLEPLTFLVNESLGRRDNTYLPREKLLHLAALTIPTEEQKNRQPNLEMHIHLLLSLHGPEASAAVHRAHDGRLHGQEDAGSQRLTIAEALELFAPAFRQALIAACTRDGLTELAELEPLETQRITAALDWISERRSLNTEMAEAKRTKNRFTYRIWRLLNIRRLQKYRIDLTAE